MSWDHGANWTALKNNFPTVPVDDIEIQAQQNDLAPATHGRSICRIFDDMTPIEKFDAGVANSDLTFFSPRTATLWDLRERRWSAGQKMFTGKNPPYGAILNYYLKARRSRRKRRRRARTKKRRKKKTRKKKTKPRNRKKLPS